MEKLSEISTPAIAISTVVPEAEAVLAVVDTCVDKYLNLNKKK
jgi:hypothetical protein